MDIVRVNSGSFNFYNPTPPLRNALYRNNRDGTFTDVTDKAGVAGGGYGQRGAFGDYYGGGFAGLYVTQYCRSLLYYNKCERPVPDVNQEDGVGAPGWWSIAG